MPSHDQESRPGVISPVVYSSLVSPVKPSRLLSSMPAFLNSTAITTTGIDSVTNENSVSTRSDHRYWCTAPYAPAATPSNVPTTVPISMQPQAHEHSPSELVVDRRVVDRATEVAVRYIADPAPEARGERRLVVHVDGIERGIDDGRRRRRVAAFVTRARIQLRGREHIGHGRGDDDEHQQIDEPA